MNNEQWSIKQRTVTNEQWTNEQWTIAQWTLNNEQETMNNKPLFTLLGFDDDYTL